MALTEAQLQELQELRRLDELEQKFGGTAMPQERQTPQRPPTPLEPQAGIGGGLPSAGEAITGVVEPGLAIATGGVGEIVGNTAGVVRDLLDPRTPVPEGTPEDIKRAKDTMQFTERIKSALTYQPRTEAGQRGLQRIGEFFQPLADLIGGAKQTIGEKVLEKTNSPSLAGVAASFPELGAEILAFGTIKGGRGVRTKSKLKREISKAAPTAEQLKTTARGVYREITEDGFTIKSDAFAKLVRDIGDDITKEAGFHPLTTPNAANTFEVLAQQINKVTTPEDLLALRKVVGGLAGNANRTEAAIGRRIIGHIDSFMLQDPKSILTGVNGLIPDKNIGLKLKSANNLWSRARKSETIDEILNIADTATASGFENGVRIEFRKLLKDKKKRKFFTSDELAEMEGIAKGSKSANLAKFLGKMGIERGQGLIGALASGSVAAAATGGNVGAGVFVVGVGTVSKKLAERLTVGRAKFLDEVIRAGRDAKQITRAYLRNTPKSRRNPAELTELLMNKNADLTMLDANFQKQLARENRNLALGVTGVGAGILPGPPLRQEQ